MTRLTYNCQGANGTMKNFFSYVQAKAYIERYGGRLKAVYEPIPEEVHVTEKAKVRRVPAYSK